MAKSVSGWQGYHGEACIQDAAHATEDVLQFETGQIRDNLTGLAMQSSRVVLEHGLENVVMLENALNISAEAMATASLDWLLEAVEP